MLNFYVNGEQREIVVDDYFPFDPEKNDWAFSKSIGKEIWVLVLEKAWAKIFGSYQRIEAGTMSEAMDALSPAAVEFIYHQQVQNKDQLWK